MATVIIVVLILLNIAAFSVGLEAPLFLFIVIILDVFFFIFIFTSVPDKKNKKRMTNKSLKQKLRTHTRYMTIQNLQILNL